MQNRLRYFMPGFTIVAAFSGLVTMVYLFFTGTVFYVAVTVCFLLDFCCVVAWQRIERTRYVKENLRMIFDRLSKKVDAEAVFQLTEIVDYFGMQNEVANTLGEMVYIKPDPTERYWLYIALGMIRGKRAESIIEKSLTDNNEFVRTVAVEAQELLRKPKRRTRKHGKLLMRYRVGEYISSVVTLSLCVVIAAAAVYHKNLSSKPPLTTQINTSIGASQRPRITDLNIIITMRGNRGDIVINMCNEKGDSLEISIMSSSSVLHLKMRI